MKIYKIILVFIIIIMFFGFSNRINVLDGVWVLTKSNEDGSFEYRKKSLFDRNKSSIEFMRNGKLLIKDRFAPCGTPPISYITVENKGLWGKLSDSTIVISYCLNETEKDSISEMWQIIELKKRKLKVKKTRYNKV